jgi:hypothetical protein
VSIDDVPDHLTFSKTRHGWFWDADLLRNLSKKTELNDPGAPTGQVVEGLARFGVLLARLCQMRVSAWSVT